MNKKYRDKSGKAIKWKDTPFGKRHYARLRFIQRAILSGLSMAASSRLATIQATPARTRVGKARKACEIASVILNHNASLVNLYKTTNIQFFNEQN